ncbi:MAG: T9SS type A sorting domain-containing protein [Bacteroidales bacterium]|nr:T9SS type A sorting domain-containing protein [Bacteroidales bacterium]
MRKGFHIQVNGHPVFILGLLLMFGCWSVFGQHTVSIGAQPRCENSSVLLPVNVSNFNDVAAFTFFISIDTLLVEFVSIENPHVQLGGAPLSNFIDQTSRIAITWSSLSALNIAEGKLFDLKLDYYEGNASLVFTDQCEVANSSGSVIANVVYQNGLLVSVLQISEQPVSVTVTEGEQAQFVINMLYGGPDFQWQHYANGVWIDLQNTANYTGVNTHELTIEEVPLAFNNYTFRCNVSYEDCAVNSNSVTLTVSPLTVVNNGSLNTNAIRVFPNPCEEVLNFDVNLPEPGFDLQLVNLVGEVVYSEHPLHSTGMISTGSLDTGIYFLQMISENRTVETIKVLIK